MAGKNIYQRLVDARKHIASTELKKEGWNDYSKYNYFTPEQVEKLVSEANEKCGIIALANLRADDHGYYQELTLVNADDTADTLRFELRTERGELKATNTTQNMGAMDTYSERYLKQKAYLIKDNTLDPDSHDNRKSPTTSQTAKARGFASGAAMKRTESFQDAKLAAESDVPTLLYDEDEPLL